jgi:hypothetical protein
LKLTYLCQKLLKFYIILTHGKLNTISIGSRPSKQKLKECKNAKTKLGLEAKTDQNQENRKPILKKPTVVKLG